MYKIAQSTKAKTIPMSEQIKGRINYHTVNNICFNVRFP